MRPANSTVLWLVCRCCMACLLVDLAPAVGGEASGRATTDSEVLVYPPRIAASVDYPAQVIVLELFSDGTSIDRTHSAHLESHGEEPELVRVSAGGVVSLANNLQIVEANASGVGLLQVRVAGRSLEVPIELGDRVAMSPIFPREIAAVLGKAGCNQGTCHGNLHGKGGLRLSLRGDDPQMDYDAILRGGGGRRVDMFSTDMSLLLRKPTGELAHQGGTRFPADSTEYRLLQRWIEEGCQWHVASTSDLEQSQASQQATAAREKVVALQVYPAQCLLSSQCRQQQLAVVATFGDGQIRDVTRWARFESSSPTGVEITSAGLVSVDRPIDIGVSVSYLSGRAASRLTFLPPRQTQWSQSPAPTRLDEIAESQLQRLQIDPAPLAEEHVFLRRIYLTTVGRLPVSDEVRRFLGTTDPSKHQRLVDELLHDPAYATLWAMRWSDMLRNEQKVMSPKGTTQWHAWMREQIAADVPLTDFVRETLTSIGSTYENPPASFHRTHREPETAAETIGQVFLGVRLQCTRCHNHPFDRWRQDDYYGLAAYFSRIDRQAIDNKPKDTNDKHIITGDEIITLGDRRAEIWHPGLAHNVPPKPLTATYPAATEIASETTNPLVALADWLTTDNRMFARNLANRIWYHVMGRGIVDPPDDFRDSNPPSNPELLEYLTDELIESGYSVRYLTRLILNSRTFARAAIEDVEQAEGLDATALFAGYPLRRVSAEVLFDAISDVTQVYNTQRDSGETPTAVRYAADPGVPERANFLTTFGKPNRLLVCECERSDAFSLGQSLVLVNGSEVRDKLATTENVIDRISTHEFGLSRAIEELYLTALTRYPSDEELKSLETYINDQPERRLGFEDVLWALINSKEFALVR